MGLDQYLYVLPKDAVPTLCYPTRQQILEEYTVANEFTTSTVTIHYDDNSPHPENIIGATVVSSSVGTNSVGTNYDPDNPKTNTLLLSKKELTLDDLSYKEGYHIDTVGEDGVFRREEVPLAQLHYWRKHSDLEGYMSSIWHEQNPGKGDFNCEFLELTEDIINEVIELSQTKGFSEASGFGWGQTYDEDHEVTIQAMQKALKYMKDGYKVFYSSWW